MASAPVEGSGWDAQGEEPQLPAGAARASGAGERAEPGRCCMPGAPGGRRGCRRSPGRGWRGAGASGHEAEATADSDRRGTLAAATGHRPVFGVHGALRPRLRALALGTPTPNTALPALPPTRSGPPPTAARQPLRLTKAAVLHRCIQRGHRRPGAGGRRRTPAGWQRRCPRVQARAGPRAGRPCRARRDAVRPRLRLSQPVLLLLLLLPSARGIP